MQKSLGLIETIGLTAAIEAADAAVKSANVELVGYELARGDGMTLVKIEGDVGAVKAAVEAARMAAGKVGRVAGCRVIARPAGDIQYLVRSRDTVGYTPPSPPPAAPPPSPAPAANPAPSQTAAPQPATAAPPPGKKPPAAKKPPAKRAAAKAKPAAKPPQKTEAPKKEEPPKKPEGGSDEKP